jgi:hypothetical protein
MGISGAARSQALASSFIRKLNNVQLNHAIILKSPVSEPRNTLIYREKRCRFWQPHSLFNGL